MANVSFELPTEDTERAAAFFRKVFGWSMQRLPELDYVLITAGKGDGETGERVIVGGLTPRSDLVRAPVPILGVDSIDEALARVQGAGGKQITAKEQVGEFGFSSYIEDSEGNVLCLWEDA